ncbi:EamA family transporter [Escherichia coli]|nr:EamA family transporter [Escherichia coli]
MVPATAGADVSHVDLIGCALALGAGACWAIYILSGQRAGRNMALRRWLLVRLIAALIFVPIGALQAGEALWHWSVIPLGLAVAILSTALPYSLEMIALTRLPTRTFGTLMSMEPALAAVSGMIFLGETLTPIQLLALGAIIAASMGLYADSTQRGKIKELDIN